MAAWRIQQSAYSGNQRHLAGLLARPAASLHRRNRRKRPGGFLQLAAVSGWRRRRLMSSQWLRSVTNFTGNQRKILAVFGFTFWLLVIYTIAQALAILARSGLSAGVASHHKQLAACHACAKPACHTPGGLCGGMQLCGVCRRGGLLKRHLACMAYTGGYGVSSPCRQLRLSPTNL